MTPRSDPANSLTSNPQGPEATAPDESFETFCQKQLLRIKQTVEALPTIEKDAIATPVAHAAGKKKPSLGQTELEGFPWILTGNFRRGK